MWHATAFDAWLSEHGIQLAEIGDAHIDQFHRRSYRPRSDCQAAPRRHEVSSLLQLLRYLREHQLCAPAPVATVPADDVVSDFGRFLIQDRGLAASTVGYYRSNAKSFLLHRFGTGEVDLGVLQAADIIGFVREQSRRTRPRSLKMSITALRAFLRYASYRGEIKASLIEAVPAVAAWSTTPPLPRAIASEHAIRVIDSCDPHTTVGLRDRAILLLLARLGLRGGEVINLQLDDIEWDTGRLRVRGKSHRECLMPLPADVGEAIAAYLQHGRPQSTDRHLFLKVRAPIRGLLQESDAVGSIVGHALARAGIDAPHRGSHQFRHALAVHMLKGGASLPEIGKVLRHRSLISTSIYAKVDVATLRNLALPWPGGVA